MSKKTVSYTLDTLPPLTAAQKANLSSLAALPDEEIDTRDIPELSDEQWQSAVRGQFCKPTKALVTARLDRDVLEWLKPARYFETRCTYPYKTASKAANKGGRRSAWFKIAHCFWLRTRCGIRRVPKLCGSFPPERRRQ